jgi:hypothetical protein
MFADRADLRTVRSRGREGLEWFRTLETFSQSEIVGRQRRRGPSSRTLYDREPTARHCPYEDARRIDCKREGPALGSPYPHPKRDREFIAGSETETPCSLYSVRAPTYGVNDRHRRSGASIPPSLNARTVPSPGGEKPGSGAPNT